MRRYWEVTVDMFVGQKFMNHHKKELCEDIP